eukprot:5217174-Prorocentrum_lima.AAC.1
MPVFTLFAVKEHTINDFQVFVLRPVCVSLQVADKRRNVGPTHDEPNQCTQKASAALVHLFSAKALGVDVNMLCVDGLGV